MADDDAATKKKRKFVRVAFSGDVGEALAPKISRWIAGDVGIMGLGFGIKFAAKRRFVDTKKSLAESARISFAITSRQK